MKHFSTIIVTAALVSTGFVRGQTDSATITTQPAAATVAPAETSAPMPAPAVYTDPPQLFPEVPLPEAQQQAQSGLRSRQEKRKTDAVSEDIKDRIRFREVRTLALKDPDVQRQLVLVNGAKNDAEKREAFRDYYKALYGRMAKIDPSLKVRAKQKQEEALAQLAQIRIEPTSKATPALPTVAEQIRIPR